MKTHLTTYLVTACLGSALLLPQASRAQTPVPPAPSPAKPESAPSDLTGIIAIAAPQKSSEEQALQARIREFDTQRPAAAQAVFRLGECYRRLKRYEEARVQYARILREFPDSPELVAQSARLLLELGKSADPTAGANAAPSNRAPVLSNLPVIGNLYTTPSATPAEKPSAAGTNAAISTTEAAPAPGAAPAKEAAPSSSDADPTRSVPLNR